MSDLVKTPFKNLYYRLNSQGLKVYIAMFYKDKKRYKKTLGVIKLVRAKKELKLYRLDVESQLTDLTYEDVFLEYVDSVRLLQTNKEIKTKISIFNNHLQKISKIDITHIKYMDCQKVINNALDNGLAPKTAKNIKAVIQVVFNFAIKQEYCDSNPATLIEIPKFDNKQYLKISINDAKELYRNILLCPNPVVRDIMILGFHGRRLSECLELQWYQINLDDKFYTLPYQKNKSKKHLEFSMTDTLYSMFKDRYKSALDNDMYSGDDYVFVNPNTLTKYTTITKSFKRVKINSGIPIEDFRFHDFRHLLGTYGINELHKTIEEVSHSLGHSGIEVTQIYVTKNKETAKNVCDSYLNFITSDCKDL